MITPRREVVIVGGGPAGTTAALLLARAGHDVLLLERAAMPRPKPCGDCLSAGASRVLDRLGLLAGINALGPARLHGWRVIAPDGSSFTARFRDVARGDARLETALALPRDRLDALLLDAAAAAGADVRTGTYVTRIEPEPTGGCRLYVRKEDAPLHARLVIGADGLRSVVARSLGAVRRAPRLRKLSLSAHVQLAHDTAGLGEMHLAPDACIGIAPVAADARTFNLTLVVTGHAVPAGAGSDRDTRLAAFVEHWCRRFPLLHDLGPLHPQAEEGWLASGPFDRPVRQVAFDGVALAGDAAGYYDPFTGQGIHHALAGAEQLAAVAARALRRSGPVRREHLADWSDAHASLTRGTRRVQHLIEMVLARPALANAAIRALARSAPARDALLAVTGDLRSARSLLDPRLAAAALLSLVRVT